MGEPDPNPGGSGPLASRAMINGTVTKRTLPAWMDPKSNHGELSLLRMEAVGGKLPRNPFTIRTSIDRCVGETITGAFPESRGEFYTLKVRNPSHVSKLLALTELVDKTSIRIIHHPTLNASKCVVSCYDVIDIPDQELLSSLSNQGVIGIRRFTRRDGNRIVNTPSMILTINSPTPPDHIDFGYLRVNTRPYYPSPMLCYRCWSFGHTRLRCQATAICGNCAKNNHPLEDRTSCPNTQYCQRCDSNNHALSSKNCPFYQKEKDIQKLRVDQGLSYPAANRLYNAQNNVKTYANVTNASNGAALADLTAKVAELTKMLHEKEERIKAMEERRSTRMQAVAANGTIEDLVKQVNFLKESSGKKDHEISTLRRVLDSVRKSQSLKDPEQTPTCNTLLEPALIVDVGTVPKEQRKAKKPKGKESSKTETRLNQQQQSTPKRNSSPVESNIAGVKSKISKKLPDDLLNSFFSDSSIESGGEACGGTLDKSMEIDFGDSQ